MVRTLGRSLSCEGKQGNRRYVNWDEILWPLNVVDYFESELEAIGLDVYVSK